MLGRVWNTGCKGKQLIRCFSIVSGPMGPAIDPFSEAGIVQCLLNAEEEVENVDPDLHHCFQYLNGPPGIKGASLSLRALNLELVKLVDYEGTPNAKKLRFEWWRDTLSCMAYEGEIYQRSPVLRLIAVAARSFRWEPRRLAFFVDAREKVASMSGFWTLEDIENYSELVYSNTYYLQLSCWPGDLTEDETSAASHSGAAIGLANYLRNVPYGIQEGRCLIPGQLIEEFKLDTEEEEDAFLEAKSTPKCKACIKSWADRIEAHLDRSWSLRRALTKEKRTVLMANMPTRLFLKRLKKNKYDIFHRDVYLLPGTDKELLSKLNFYRFCGWY